jgi:hypothetical protein
MNRVELTQATKRYPPDAVAAALDRISSQGLWLLLSLDTYGWRAEYDAIRAVLDAQPGDEATHYAEHAPLLAFGHLFALTDKLWRLIYGIRAHRAGREFLNVGDGYLTAGYKFHKKLEQLQAVSVEEWEQLLGIPGEATIRAHLAEMDADDAEINSRVALAASLPELLATNMRELNQYVECRPAIAGPRDTTATLRELDGQYRHGAPVVYHDCSPTLSNWVAIDERAADDNRRDTVGLLMSPPDDDRAALIPLVKYDDEMTAGLRNVSTAMAALVHRLVKAQLLYLSPGLVEDPLAVIAKDAV